MNKINDNDINKTLASENGNKSLTRRFIWIMVAVLTVSILSYLFINKNKKTIEYNTTPVVKKDLVVTVSATGNLEPTNSVDVGIEVSGTILEIYVDYNDIVKKGQLLAKLDTKKLESHVASTKAALNVAKANLLESKIAVKDAKRELNRVKDLYKATNGNYPSTKEIDSAVITYEKSKATYESLMAQKEQAQALLESNEEDLKKAVVISPINGVVLNKAVEIGQSVVASMQIPILFTLAENLKKMEVIVSVDEADVGEVKEGQTVTFTVDAYPSKVFTGIIKQVRMNSQIVNNVVTYETVVTVDNSNLLLRPGMTVSADITTKVIKDAFLVPNSALRFSPPKKEEKEDKGFTLFAPSSTKDKLDLSTDSKQLWILEDGVAKQIAIELGDSDGINSVLLNKDITINTEVILSIKENK